MSAEFRIGQGADAHRLVAGRPLKLGGIEVPYERGLEGHSDGDVLLHAITSALLGALGKGDLGAHFPSSDPRYAGIASAQLLRWANALVPDAGLRLLNLDATIIAQAPRLASQREAMQQRIAELLEVDAARINVKVTSSDGLGSLGRTEGIAALAVVLLGPVSAGSAP